MFLQSNLCIVDTYRSVQSCLLFGGISSLEVWSNFSTFKLLLFPLLYLRVCLTWKRINRGVGYGLENAREYVFYCNEKAIQWAKKTLEGADGNVKKMLRCLKQSYFLKKMSYFLLVFCFFWPVRYCEVIFTGIIQAGLELYFC